MVQYAIYAEMTEVWKSLNPSNWMDVELDNFVNAPKPILEDILTASALPFVPACLEPEKHTGAVSTLSKWQVRQGLSSSISDEWKNYLPFIKQRFLS